MNIQKIIIQAGGKGNRLKPFTENMPKCMVSVMNLPIIFHLFNKFPNAKFIIIVDYKYKVLKKYLNVFAKKKCYTFVKTKGNGNLSGVKDALKYIDKNEEFLLIWSDLILSNKFDVTPLSPGNYVGLFDGIECSWMYTNNLFEKRNTIKNGVAGLFLFKNKNILKNIPKEGSFVSFLKKEKIMFHEILIKDSFEVGTLEQIKKINNYSFKTRPYNKIQISENFVEKIPLTNEASNLIKKEVSWYDKMIEYGFLYIPQVYKKEPLSLQKICGKNIFSINNNKKECIKILENILSALNLLHSYEFCGANKEDLLEEYYYKIILRLNNINKIIPFAKEKYININGKICKNPILFFEDYKKSVEENLLNTFFCPIHGDCTLTNTLIDKNNKIYFIDPRGYFGKTNILGDIHYDWAKLYYSFVGNFDNFNIRNFLIKINKKDIFFEVKSNELEYLSDIMCTQIKSFNLEKIKFIHSIIWLSLSSHCWDDYDSMCLAFYNGVYLINEFL